MYRYLLAAVFAVSSAHVAQAQTPAQAAATPALPEAPALPAAVPAPAPAATAEPAKPAKKARKAAAAPEVAAPAKAAKVKRSAEDIDLWAFSSANAIAPGGTIDALKALPGFVSEKRDEIKPAIEGKEVPKYPQPVTLNYEGDVRVRLIDYGTQAFVSQVKVSSASRELADGIKVGMTREQIEGILGVPTRGTSYHMVYEGKTDTIRFLFASGIVSSVEIDRGA